MRRRLGTQKGFTLVELLLVVAVVAMLAALWCRAFSARERQGEANILFEQS